VSDSCPIPEGLRRQLVEVVAELGEALRSGDLQAARAAHHGLRELLEAHGERAQAVDLTAEATKDISQVGDENC
jgi:hypothetical protein